MIDKIVPFLIAAGVGFAIGIERERRYANSQESMGVRTFILMALLGALAGFVQQPLVTAAMILLAAALMVAAYIRTTNIAGTKRPDLGLTTEFAAGITFLLGYLSHTEPFLCAILGLVTLIVLLSRERLHEFTLRQIRSEEIQAAVILFVLGIGILPLLPTEPIDPWGLLDLHRFVMLLLLIGSVQFIGYVATRLFGPMIGFPLSGFVAGFVSSTAVFLVMPTRIKDNKMAMAACSAAIFAVASTFILLVVLVYVTSPQLGLKIAGPIFAAVGISGLTGFLCARLSASAQNFPQPKNPLSLMGTLKLGLLLGGFILAIGLIQHLIGAAGTSIISFVVGLVELHSVSIASASLFANGKIPLEAAQTNILLAALGSLTSKMLIVLVFRQKRYTPAAALAILLTTGAGVLVWWLL